MGGTFFRQFLTDAAQRLLLILIAAMLTGIVVVLLCGALAVLLTHYMPIWIALVVTAAVLLLLALLVLAIATRRKTAIGTSNTSSQKDSQADALFLADLAADSMKKSPKVTLGFALLAGIVLGVEPSLRKDILGILKNSYTPSDDS